MKTTSSLEILEARIAPAGIVTVAYNAGTGELTLTGDTADNEVNVFQTGVGTHRIEAIGTTTLTAGGLVFQDIGKLTKLTLIGGDGGDTFALANLRTLTVLSFDGGIGDDDLSGDNLSVRGDLNLSGGDGSDFMAFRGLSTLVSGNVNVTDTADGMDAVFVAQKTAIGGSILVTGGTGEEFLAFSAVSTVSVGKGIKVTDSAGGARVNFNTKELLAIGKLPTGESILFTGGSGQNRIEFFGAGATLAGGIRMTGGALADAITFQNREGAVKIGKLATGQSIFFDAGADEDSIALSSPILSLAGGLEFVGGDGENTVGLEAPNGKTTIGKLATGQSIKFTGGADIDTLSTASAALTLAGGIDFAGGADENTVSLSGPNGSVKIGKLATGQSIKYLGGAADDFLLTDVAHLTTAGGIEFAGGDGANIVYLRGGNGDVVLGKLVAGQSVLYSGGTGADDLRSDQPSVVMAGGIEFTGGDGTNAINFDNGGLVKFGTIASGQSVKQTGGAGDDRLVLGGRLVLLKGSVELTGGDGGNLLDLDGAAVSVGKTAAGVSVLLTGGTGADTIDLADNLTLGGALTLDGGAGSDFLDLDSLKTFKAMGAVTLTGGAGDDTLDLQAVALTLGSTLTVTGGDDSDSVNIDAEGSIAGNVTLDLGAATAGDQSATLTGKFGLPGALVLKGALTVTGTGAAATTDTLALLNVAVAKAINASLGAGASSVFIDNLRAGDTLTLATNDGADLVEVERVLFFGNSTIAKLATILAGAGDDQVLIGNPLPAPNSGATDSTRVRFLGGLTVDGGADSDTRNAIAGENDFPGGAPTVTGFEVVVV